MRLLTVAAIFVLLLSGSVCHAQDKAAFTQLLRSETAATRLISDLQAYDAKSPWSTDIMWRLAQQLAIKGLSGQQISTAITAGGEMAAALDGDDQLFASVVLTTTDLVKQERAWLTLYELEGMGVPAFDMIAEGIGRPRGEVQKLARAGRLKSSSVFELLTAFYAIKYKGMSEKLANKRRVRDQ